MRWNIFKNFECKVYSFESFWRILFFSSCFLLILGPRSESTKGDIKLSCLDLRVTTLNSRKKNKKRKKIQLFLKYLQSKMFVTSLIYAVKEQLITQNHTFVSISCLFPCQCEGRGQRFYLLGWEENSYS